MFVILTVVGCCSSSSERSRERVGGRCDGVKAARVATTADGLVGELLTAIVLCIVVSRGGRRSGLVRWLFCESLTILGTYKFKVITGKEARSPNLSRYSPDADCSSNSFHVSVSVSWRARWRRRIVF